jgi:hypothetical protein
LSTVFSQMQKSLHQQYPVKKLATPFRLKYFSHPFGPASSRHSLVFLRSFHIDMPALAVISFFRFFRAARTLPTAVTTIAFVTTRGERLRLSRTRFSRHPIKRAACS